MLHHILQLRGLVGLVFHLPVLGAGAGDAGICQLPGQMMNAVGIIVTIWNDLVLLANIMWLQMKGKS